MLWYRLEKHKCPDCSKRLTGFRTDFIKCVCGFWISRAKFDKIVAEIRSRPKPIYASRVNQRYLKHF